MDDKKMTKHNRIKLFLKITGLLLFACGVTLVILGFMDFFSSFSSNNPIQPRKFWMFFAGFPALSIGLTLILLGFKRGIMTYFKNEAVPVINETVSDLDNSFSSVANSFKRGFTESNEKCSCGALNKKGSAFCSKCGKNLKMECSNCGNKNEFSSQYCNNCGKKL